MTSLLDRLSFVNTLGAGEAQSDEEMTVIPLIGDGLGNVAPPEALTFTRTTDYGSMKYDNVGDQPAIIPSNMMVRGKHAQDHAMSGSGVVLATSSRLFNNACCIESSQGGYFSNDQDVEEDILPVGLRRALLDPAERNRKAYDKLWGGIRTWLSGLRRVRGGRDRAHLRDFFDQPDYKEALENFAAAFEPVEGQIGALILFGGVPVGLEIMPTADHWAAYWKWLIRGCYGSQLIKLKESGELPRSTMVLPEIPDGADGEQVKDIMSQFIRNIQLSIAPMLDAIQVASQNQIDAKGSMITELIRTTGGGGGDVITQDSKPVYLSLVL